MKRIYRALLATTAVITALPVTADSTVTVKVTVMAPPPCVINNNKAIEVEFNEVLTTRVDGHNYEQPVNYTLVCTGAAKNAMQLRISGTPAGAGFDSNVLTSNAQDLGIALKNNGSPLMINEWVKFTYPATPPLTAVPVKRSGGALSGGEFLASATLQVAYQ